MKHGIVKEISIEGFKSIRSLHKLKLGKINILLGANGAGKSNFIAFFKFLNQILTQDLSYITKKNGGANALLWSGNKHTNQIKTRIMFKGHKDQDNGYKFTLEPTTSEGLVFAYEATYFEGATKTPILEYSGHSNSILANPDDARLKYCRNNILQWKVYHFHDMSAEAGVKKYHAVQNSDSLNYDASNLAAVLYKILDSNKPLYRDIIARIQLALPFFDDFVLSNELIDSNQQVWLRWRKKNQDYIFNPDQISDGSLRFICLVVALMQPKPPSTLIIDEAELGLHPYAIKILAALIQEKSHDFQIIITTQSISLVNEFNNADDLIIVEDVDNQSMFYRLNSEQLNNWLIDYTMGELWVKNIFETAKL